MVTRTELTKRVETLEAQIISQTNLTKNVETLESKVTVQERTLQNLSNTVSIFGSTLASLQKEVANLATAKPTKKRTKQ